MWTPVIDMRPVKCICFGCKQPIYGSYGKFVGENIILLENGDTLHDRPKCCMRYLRRNYLIKG